MTINIIQHINSNKWSKYIWERIMPSQISVLPMSNMNISILPRPTPTDPKHASQYKSKHTNYVKLSTLVRYPLKNPSWHPNCK